MVLLHRGAALLFALSMTRLVSAQELPENPNASVPFDIEPSLMLQDLPDLPEIAATSVVEAAAAVEQAQARFERAGRKQVRWQKLAKQGVLSRAEAESCAIEVATALVLLERARAEHSRLALEEIRQRIAGGSADATLGEAAETAWKNAAALAEEAARKLLTTRLESARVNVERHRRLHSSGLVSRNQLRRAEATLAQVESELAPK